MIQSASWDPSGKYLVTVDLAVDGEDKTIRLTWFMNQMGRLVCVNHPIAFMIASGWPVEAFI